MKKILFTLLLLFFAAVGFSTTFQVTNSGTTFSPFSTTIHEGDSVNFTLASAHDALEVSKATWDANGTTPLPGGFAVPFGGGLLVPSQLPVGTHYYVCQAHASLGMKGEIIVLNNNGIAGNTLTRDFRLFPNPAGPSITISTNEVPAGSEYVISDMTGKEMQHGSLVSATTTLDISTLETGTYLIQFAGLKASPVRFIKIR